MNESALSAADVPMLALPHVGKELEILHREKHRTHRSAIFGALADSTTEGETTAHIDGAPVRFHVRQVGSELELRLRLTEDERDDVAYLIPFARHLPRDLAARFARGAVWWPRTEQQLPRRFGARRATPRFLSSQLARVARLEGAKDYVRQDITPVDLIDLDDAWLLLLQSRLPVGTGAWTTSALLSAVLADDGKRGSALARLLDSVEGARRELADVLQRKLGRSAPIIVDGWLLDRADMIGAAALIGEGCRATLQKHAGAAWTHLLMALEIGIKSVPGHPLRAAFDEKKRDGLAEILADLGEQVPVVWKDFKQARPADAEALLKLAEQLLGTEEARATATESNRLPFTATARALALNAALESFAASPSATGLRAVKALAESLGRHERLVDVPGLASVVEMAKRLSAFLLLPDPPVREAPADDIAVLAGWQVEHGGWLDWARNEIRGRDAGPLKPGVLSVLALCDARRDVFNERFAGAYSRLMAHRGARRNLKGVAPIEQALGTFGLELLDTVKELRLLVLCMDGMSWANVVELWSRPGSPLAALIPLNVEAKDGAPPTPVLAQVPTVTQLSRTALFRGSEASPGESLDTSRDGERFAHHPAAKRLDEAPTLWLKRDLVAPAGNLNDDVRALIAKPNARAVGVVVNAIDDQLKGSSQLRIELSVQAIPVLDALLKAAEQAGRVVVLCSDHGNVSSQRFGSVPPSTSPNPEGGARWRWLGSNESPRAGEVAVPAGSLTPPSGMPAGMVRIAVPFDEVTRYTPHVHAGEHGGLTLSEAIAPLLLLAPSAVVGVLQPEDGPVSRARFEPPAWWAGDLPAAPLAPASPESKKPQALSLFPEDDLSARVLKSALFKELAEGRRKEDQEKVRRGLQALLRSGGRLGKDAFAREVGIQLPSRVPGFVATMQEFLNVDQELIVGMDTKQTLVELRITLLEKLFLGEK